MKPEIQYTQEIRFAVVMYGGVSLAIYINGIAQELLRLVRASAAGPPDDSGVRRALFDTDELRGSELTYRRLAQRLAHGVEAADVPAVLPPDAPIRTRFVVDILSGTSAGGINAIYLAKALANEQDLDGLKRLWISEGDIGRLINDAGSVSDIAPLPPDAPARSLLNGRRMYQKLLMAFRDMDRTPAAQHSRLVDDLDLFVTTTDVRGNPVPLQLADKVVYERRYRNAFHFRHRAADGSTPRIDFVAASNPLLAFAARCTSAFPFAFEPVTVPQVESVLRLFPQAGEAPLSEDALAGAFGGPAVPSTPPAAIPGARAVDALPYRERVYVDGGYLDNKPFDHAIGVLGDRSPTLPARRVLLYVEPAPEQLELQAQADNPPDALQNVGAALVTIPGYETIRQDLQRVLARNRLVERVNRVTSGAEQDLLALERSAADPEAVRDEFAAPHTAAYGDDDLGSMIRRYGIGYGGYHRLKVAETTDDIAAWCVAAAGYDVDSDETHAVRYLVRAWRNAHFTHYLSDGDERRSFNRFLMDYDIAYRIRRLRFVIRRLGVLEAGGAESHRLMQAAAPDFVPDSGADAADRQVARAAAVLRDELGAVLSALKQARALLDAPGAAGQDDTLRSLLFQAAIPASLLHDMFDESDEDRRMAYARGVLGMPGGKVPAAWNRADGERAHRALDEAATWVARHIADASVTAAREVARVLADDEARTPLQHAVYETVRYAYHRFEAYDMAAYPALAASQAGSERDEVDVVRVSPLDAVALYDPAQRGGASKLAGTSLHNFGAFLDVRWRRNDMLWGRLDGAERLVAALLPGTHRARIRNSLTEDAQKQVLGEELRGSDREAVTGLIARLATADGGELPDAVHAALRESAVAGGATGMLRVLRGLATDDALYHYFRSAWVLDRQLDRAAMARSASRGTRVIGEMLSGMAATRGAVGRGAWVARGTAALWALVEVAMPDSPLRTVTRHLTAVFVLFALLLLGAGLVFGSPGIGWLGAAVLLTVSALGIGTAVMHDYLRRGHLARIAGSLLATTLLGFLLYFATVGALHTANIDPILGGIHLPTAVALAVAAVVLGQLLRDLTAIAGGVRRSLVRLTGRRRAPASAAVPDPNAEKVTAAQPHVG